MKRSYGLLAACCLSAALLVACGGSNLSSSMPVSVTPQAAPGVAASYASHRVKKNVQTETVLYSFAGGSDGVGPWSDLTNVAGTLYGTTYEGGTRGDGTVFKITTSGTYSQLYSFAGYPRDGGGTRGGLTNVRGVLYGTTSFGGTSNNGTVFTIYNGENVLYSFAGDPDGYAPVAGLTNVGGTLYGTTSGGGFSGYGTVFKITTSGTESLLYSFAGGSDGAYPQAALTNVGGTLYGTTSGVGTSGYGTVFKITTSGTESAVYSFAGGSDGAYPQAGLINVGGTLYGTTSGGGANGEGVIFALLKKSHPEFVLHSFGSGSDGGFPRAGLTNVGGTLYGTTFAGGTSGVGTVFSFSF